MHASGHHGDDVLQISNERTSILDSQLSSDIVKECFLHIGVFNHEIGGRKGEHQK
tara:strand:- start:179 stop:343 length:165 start_codon:yes stop_codon:yes gene_type:complete